MKAQRIFVCSWCGDSSDLGYCPKCKKRCQWCGKAYQGTKCESCVLGFTTKFTEPKRFVEADNDKKYPISPRAPDRLK